MNKPEPNEKPVIDITGEGQMCIQIQQGNQIKTTQERQSATE